MMNLKLIPKIELHVHLDGSARPDTVADILDMNLDDVKRQMIAPYKCKDLNDYLDKFSLPIKAMQTRENLERIAYEVATDIKNDGCIYAEIRFAPLKHITTGMSLYNVIESVLRGLDRVDLKTNLILCMMRDAKVQENMQVIDFAKHYLNNGVCAVDLAGAESIYETKDFAELFEYAESVGVPFTIHAGEAAGIDSISSAISFHTNRIGHGIRIIEDDKIINEVINKNILLEICPTSNIQTNVITDFENHPIKKLHDMGVKISINTDNRTVSNTTLTREYQLLESKLGFTEEDFVKINRQSIEFAFLSEDEKKKLRNKFNSLVI
ncbi:MAG TPA: adenosine deaminase [Bacilli bacterium]|nr:adenosine deaminase [Bacilli bacterium]